MALLTIKDLKSVISNALSVEVEENADSSNIPEWDSLGHLSVLSALDEKTDGATSDISGISELDSFKKLRDRLISEGLIDES